VIVAHRNGAPVRLSDVASVDDGQENNRLIAWMNTTQAVIVNVQRQPGANVIAVVDSIKALLPRLRETLPPSIDVSILTDRTRTSAPPCATCRSSCPSRCCWSSLSSSCSWATGARPSSPASRYRCRSWARSRDVSRRVLLNNLSIMALTIAAGFVVDDAIVMIENIARYIEEGDDPFEAALKGSSQIAFTVVSLTVSLIAVLIPLLFMGDVGRAAVQRVRHYAGCHYPDLGGGVAHPGSHDVRAAPAPPQCRAGPDRRRPATPAAQRLSGPIRRPRRSGARWFGHADRPLRPRPWSSFSGINL